MHRRPLTPRQFHDALLTQELAAPPAELFGVELQLIPCIVGCLAAFILVDAAIYFVLRALLPKV